MKSITVSLDDSSADETIQAEYFQIEDGWVTFKTEDGKAVVAYPERRVTRIKSGADEAANAASVTASPFPVVVTVTEAFAKDRGFTSIEDVYEAINENLYPSSKLRRAEQGADASKAKTARWEGRS